MPVPEKPIPQEVLNDIHNAVLNNEWRTARSLSRNYLPFGFLPAVIEQELVAEISEAVEAAILAEDWELAASIVSMMRSENSDGLYSKLETNLKAAFQHGLRAEVVDGELRMTLPKAPGRYENFNVMIGYNDEDFIVNTHTGVALPALVDGTYRFSKPGKYQVYVSVDRDISNLPRDLGAWATFELPEASEAATT